MSAPPPVRHAVLPAAGWGTRLRPLTDVIAKEVLPVGRRLVIQYVLEECEGAGLDRLLVVGNPRKSGLEAACAAVPTTVDPATEMPQRIVYFVHQEPQRGLAHAVLHAEAFVGDAPFVVALADTIIEGPPGGLLSRLIAAHLERGAVATIAAERVDPERVSRYGILEPDGRIEDVFRVRSVVEKPAPAEAPSRYAIAARYVLSPLVFDACRQAGRSAAGEMDLTQAFTWLAQRGHLVLGVCLGEGEERLDIGSPASYFAAFARKAAGLTGSDLE